MGVFFGFLKIQIFFFGCLKFLIFFGVNSRCWGWAYVCRKNESTPLLGVALVKDFLPGIGSVMTSKNWISNSGISVRQRTLVFFSAWLSAFTCMYVTRSFAFFRTTEINQWPFSWALNHLSRDMWFPTMLQFDNCRLRRACAPSLWCSVSSPS